MDQTADIHFGIGGDGLSPLNSVFKSLRFLRVSFIFLVKKINCFKGWICSTSVLCHTFFFSSHFLLSPCVLEY